MQGRAPGYRAIRVAALALVAFVVVSVVALDQNATASPPAGLDTAIFDPVDITSASADQAFARVAETGAAYVRISLLWNVVAPSGSRKPSGFDASNPGSTRYNWSGVDTLVTRAITHNLTPVLDIVGAPRWALGPATSDTTLVRPDPAEFGSFAHAAALRYSGTYGVLPRVTYWQAWNEPNEPQNLAPQKAGSVLISPAWYRQMVNAFARGVHSVHADDKVIAGGLAPYASTTGTGIPPLTFMKSFLCLTGRQVAPRPACLERTHFDIFSVQPYTWGSPVHKATVTGDVALGDLPSVKAALDQAWGKGLIVGAAEPEFWVTEFSYDTNPPDTGAVPIAVVTRWTSESLYRMWQAGVTVATWFMIRDQARPSIWQSGLWSNGGDWSLDTKKPIFEAFRFPVVAFPVSGGTLVWARVPPGVSGNVTFKVGSGSSFTTIGTIAPSNGIATGMLPSEPASKSIEGVLSTNETSIPFSLTNDPDCPGPAYCPVDPFGN